MGGDVGLPIPEAEHPSRCLPDWRDGPGRRGLLVRCTRCAPSQLGAPDLVGAVLHHGQQVARLGSGRTLLTGATGAS